ncbi:hypothetical protein [Brucella gallinifaecis]|uniref:hypothetical protein n=1 Tax=Brucella gallinifaecis TaxID=215590 RepID=UPI00235F79E1|nr:hypothetical protein [Brucella gallinifaecis]
MKALQKKAATSGWRSSQIERKLKFKRLANLLAMQGLRIFRQKQGKKSYFKIGVIAENTASATRISAYPYVLSHSKLLINS